MPDVLIAGGGVIGLSIAWELASHGASVTVIDQGPIGREASWAGAGMLPPGCLDGASGGEAQLRAYSHSLWTEWSEELQQSTGIDNGYRVCGGVELSFDGDLNEWCQIWRDEGNVVEKLTTTQLRQHEPAVTDSIADAFVLPEFGQVRNPRQLKALISACHDAGVQLLEGNPLLEWEQSERRVTAAVTTRGRFEADQFVTACGAWSRRVLSSVNCDVTTEPVRGQILLLKTPRPQFTRVLQVGTRYLVPRPDGRILVGSTEERAGFVKQNTVEGVQGLLNFAVRVVPGLNEAELERCWSGLRPAGRGDTPYLGTVPQLENLYVATGHFRSGLQMSPGTAVLMRQLLLGQEPAVSMDTYALPRHDASPMDVAETSAV